ncbi:methyltransferase domain-containing protein [Xanthovirga aplysinae]|uniref:methyltransferase domain-containing protein n=1 Tax=Xanthovirga aplysinae TaxID=2529853 RepID=UPI0012BC2EF9|nr:methyltransferase domain-containing protein [Xanthovirga aplysinae]MTI29664.1 methyltransferase domain-containing protein [Xanthovirga aplysinae]
MKELNEEYWSKRYLEGMTQWDIGAISTPLKEYFEQLTNKSLKILIPGCGNSYEASFLYEAGFENVFLLDISEIPLRKFNKKFPLFPKDQLIHDDFFELKGFFDLIIEQTFFCAIDPELRWRYAEKAAQLLNKNGRLVGVLWNHPMNNDKPPFGGSAEEYVKYFEPYFEFSTYEPCYNSIPPRAGRELFVNLVKKGKGAKN